MASVPSAGAYAGGWKEGAGERAGRSSAWGRKMTLEPADLSR